ncbi:hypothetical protein FANTH_14952 [Fusarium anthophilum]|uniref:Uncharacterized protein n=1 Tax=Fusarium anthophilum TaxID=48485 RepID=A0A8H4YF58_9HYPO|nr:hypothetical protein FANTH_14952 [Fusarium anthophilum]
MLTSPALPVQEDLADFHCVSLCAGSGLGRPHIHIAQCPQLDRTHAQFYALFLQHNRTLNSMLGALAIPDQQDVTAPKNEGGKMACTHTERRAASMTSMDRSMRCSVPSSP